MPRKTKEKNEEIEAKPIKKTTRSKKASAEKTLAKKSSSKKTTRKKVINIENSSTEVTSKESINIEKEAENKKEIQKSSRKKATSKKAESTKKKTNTSSKVSKRTPSNVKKKGKSKPPIEILEYYDLPYRYNQTIVRILAQTPTTIFVYWDISDEDKKHYIEQYGEYFFNNTKPVLIIHNKTMNYSFEIDINDFANSWYLHVQDGNCDYQVELGRRPINQYIEVPNNYLHITYSNDYITQNDHVLLDKLSHFVYFRNVKTNENFVKNIANFTLLQKIGKFDIKKFYEILYPNECLEFEKFHFENPSSR